MTVTEDTHALFVSKQHQIFGADTAFYLGITEYGTSYMMISSETALTTPVKWVDLRNDKTIWEGTDRGFKCRAKLQ